MVSPDSLGTACPLSGRNSTYRLVQISETSSFWTDITIVELKAFFARNDILASSNINDFVRMKKAREKEAELRMEPIG
jgi:hypothetical protein